ncbi:sugar phosphate isomerase/epimerase family protein [Streptosporangium sp. NPDC006007]|uniref:sugar phosphate isomerase/epimerase family protein n=1 Tax=Streptosporangium sp. NPDC006007 TaxID=3154575 RepID=UPI0033AA12C3
MSTAPASPDGAATSGAAPFTPCLNPATLSGVALPQFLALAAAAGFSAVELSIQQALAHGLDRVGDLLAEHRLSVAAASGILPAGPVLPAPLLTGPDAYQACLAGLGERLAGFAALGCPVATTVLNPRSDLPQAQALEVALHRIGVLADAAAEHGVLLAVEAVSVQVGLPPDLDGPYPVASTLPQLTDLLAQAGRGNVVALVDSFHWAVAGAEPGHITGLGAGTVGHVQIADTPAAGPAWSDAARRFPGDGALPWPVLAQALTDVDYIGAVSVELFNPDLRALPEQEIARRSHQAATGCWHIAEVPR